MSSWVGALKLWNGDNKTVNTKNVWGVPRKGTTDHIAVKKIMAIGKVVPKKRMAKKINYGMYADL